MARATIDARGLETPLPTLKLTERLLKKDLRPGDVVEITGDCPMFESNVKGWCTTFRKVLVKFEDEQGVKVATIRI